ncbi:MAG: ATP-dependent 6-phosphofructokinase [Bacteroidia bacterium]|nr:ATP-dependent 6-phosphofructokinase [Bacteroidia bacterium]
MRNVAIVTTGGDAPGINAALRAVVIPLIRRKVKVWGILEGYEGLIHGLFIHIESGMFSGLLPVGGTVLRSSRSAAFRTRQGRKKAFEQLAKRDIDTLVVVGGNGSLFGACVFAGEFPIKVIGIPKTIDNDVAGTDYSIGFDTALNNAVEAIDKIRESATSHNRVFFVEVMGRDAGHIALLSGIVTGSEVICIPETRSKMDMLEKSVRAHLGKNKSPMIVVVAEGDDAGHAMDIARRMKKRIRRFNPGVSVLGYIQRGGVPTVFDRYLGTAMGSKAADCVLKRKSGLLVTYNKARIGVAPLKGVKKGKRPIDRELLKLAHRLGQVV